MYGLAKKIEKKNRKNIKMVFQLAELVFQLIIDDLF